jgi:hypothetical protein
MKKIRIETTFRKMLSDIFTPVGIYLRVRDRFRDTVLLESTDYHAAENSYSLFVLMLSAGLKFRCRANGVQTTWPAYREISTEFSVCTDPALEFHGAF